jgi:hypothetical protein
MTSGVYAGLVRPRDFVGQSVVGYDLGVGAMILVPAAGVALGIHWLGASWPVAIAIPVVGGIAIFVGLMLLMGSGPGAGA